jgi:hypothetical protein
MSDDSYHSIGARQDRERTWQLASSQIAVLTRIADALDAIVKQLDRLVDVSADK